MSSTSVLDVDESGFLASRSKPAPNRKWSPLHLVAAVSYAQGVSRCTCGFVVEADRRLPAYDRNEALAAAMNEHTRSGRGQRRAFEPA